MLSVTSVYELMRTSGDSTLRRTTPPEIMQPLGTIGQALYMRLFFHLANLYDGANRPGQL